MASSSVAGMVSSAPTPTKRSLRRRVKRKDPGLQRAVLWDEVPQERWRQSTGTRSIAHPERRPLPQPHKESLKGTAAVVSNSRINSNQLSWGCSTVCSTSTYELTVPVDNDC